MTRYLNFKSVYGVETVDSLCSDDFQSAKEFRKELSRLVREYHLAGMPVYVSRRCTKDWNS